MRTQLFFCREAGPRAPRRLLKQSEQAGPNGPESRTVASPGGDLGIHTRGRSYSSAVVPSRMLGYSMATSWRHRHVVCRQQDANGRCCVAEANAPREHHPKRIQNCCVWIWRVFPVFYRFWEVFYPCSDFFFRAIRLMKIPGSMRLTRDQICQSHDIVDHATGRLRPEISSGHKRHRTPHE